MRLAPIAAACLVAAPVLAAAAPPPTASRTNAGGYNLPSVQASTASAQSDNCSGIQSAAYSTPMLAVTFDLQRTERTCARIRKAKALQGLADQLDQLGRPDTALGLLAGAIQLMCGDADVAAAMRRAGSSCQLGVKP